MPPPLTYRSVKGSKLTIAEADGNVENTADNTNRITVLEATSAREIDDVVQVGNEFHFLFTDASTSSDITLPDASWNYIPGGWQPSTAYSVLDAFVEDGVLYEVIFAHTSGLTFDPDANDGLGHDYYEVKADFSDALDTVDFAPEVATVTDAAFSISALLDYRYVRCTNGGAITVTVVTNATVAFDVGTEIYFRLSTDGATITFAPAGGVTLNGDTLTLTALGAVAMLKKVATNSWDVVIIDPGIVAVNAADVVFDSSTDITSTDVQSAIEEVFAAMPDVTGKLSIASNLSDLANAATARDNLGVEIGVDVQAYDAQLSSLVRQNSQSTAYTTVLTDGGKHILHPTADNNARTFTIAANASVAYPIGTVITFVNEINTVTIAITSDTLTLMGTGSTGSRTLAANGIATALKITSTKWVISGTGLT